MTKNLILIPGLLCTDDMWLDQIGEFEEDFDLFLFDHTSHDNMPDMVSAFLDDAPDRFNLAGLSLGGYIAFETIRQAQDRVEKLILLDTNARADRDPQIEFRESLIKRAESEDIQVIAQELTEYLLHSDRMQDEELCQRILEMAEEIGTEGFINQQRAMIARPDSRGFLPDITCPTLILCGEQDAMTPPKVHQEMADLIPGALYHQIADCGHLSSMEQPEAVNRLMREFLVA